MSAWVEHIANVSFTQHFLGIGGDAPVNKEIGVNDNVFDVTFENGHVNARFTSGNWFTNLFRGKTSMCNLFASRVYTGWKVES